MGELRIDLKTFLGLAMPNQYSNPKLSESKYQAGFGVIILGQNPLAFMILADSTTVLYDSTHCTPPLLIQPQASNAFHRLSFQTHAVS